MHALGVSVLQQLSLDRDGKRVTYTYFDTEPQGSLCWASSTGRRRPARWGPG